MWSEALRILDENSLKYYVEELKEELDKKDAVINEKDAAFDKVLSEKNTAMKKLDERNADIDKLKKEVEALKAQLGTK